MARALSLYLLVVVLWSVPPASAGVEPPALFADAHPFSTWDRFSAEDVRRVRSVRLRRNLIEHLTLVGANRLRMNFFDDASWVVTFDTVDERGPGRRTWKGNVEGVPGSRAFLVVEHEAVVARVEVPGRAAFDLRRGRTGGHMVRELAARSDAACGFEPAEPGRSGAEMVMGGPGGCADDGSVIDLLVVYTEAARISEGGVSGITALIQLGVSLANDRYANSGINTVLQLVGTSETSYVESGDSSTDLLRIRDGSDGFMDSVHALRDSLDADLVTLFVDTAESGLCGRAYFAVTFENVPHEDRGFNLIKCYGTLAHEVGHNQGCRHDNDGANGAFAYSRGYATQQFRTVMAVTGGTPIANFSNPNVLHMGMPTGQAGSADCAGSINNSSLNVANFRCSFFDCNNNTVEDMVDISSGASLDCNLNGIPDECEADCNANSVPDECDIALATSIDCDGNMIPDECDLTASTYPDCNSNQVPDLCDIGDGFSPDCNGNGTPDECDPGDCNLNQIPDDCDIASGASGDCNGNESPDECDLATGSSLDTDGTLVPDECEDCNGNMILDSADISGGASSDANNDAIPDECENVQNIKRGRYHSTINLGLGAAFDGDTIVVAPGTYAEAVDFLGKGVVLRSTAGPLSTTIDATGLGAPVVTMSGGVGSLRIEGFTLTGGSGALQPGGDRYGGGVYVAAPPFPAIIGCILDGNTADFGAGLYLTGSNGSLAVVVNSIFRNNAASAQGGGMFVESSLAFYLLSGSVFHGNSAGVAGGAIASNSTIVQIINNSVLRGNGPVPIQAIVFPPISNSNYEGAPATAGNIDADPRFVDAPAGDFRLLDDSPGIDTGAESGLPLDFGDFDHDGNVSEPFPIDIAGNPRIEDGDENGTPQVDMGAFEYVPPGPSPIPDGTGGTQPLEVERLTVSGSTLRLSWDDQCSPPGTKILYGALSQVAGLQVDGSVCSVSTPATWTSVPSGSLWFLVVSDDGASIESSWGQATAGERNGSVPSGTCGASLKRVTGVCP